MKTLISGISFFNAMLRDSGGAVLLEYALAMLLLSLIGFLGFINIAGGVSGMYHRDTLGMARLVTNPHMINTSIVRG